MRALERQDAALLILFLVLIAYPLLFLFRAHDDNTLTSWRWIFAHVSPARVFVLILPAAGLSLALSRVHVRERHAPVLLFVLACSAVIPLWSEPELIVDASRYFLQAAHLEREGAAAFSRDWGGKLDAWTDLPLLPFLFGLLFRLLGEHRIIVQAFTTLLFALAVVQTYRIGRRLWDRETGFLAGLLLLAMPYLLTQVPLMLVDVPTLCLVTMSISAYLDALERGGPFRMAFTAAAIAGAVLAKYSAWPMLLVLPLITLIAAREQGMPAVRRSAAVLAAAAVIAGIVLLPRHELVRGQLALLRSYQWPALGQWGESTASSLLFQVHPLVTLCAAVGAARAVRDRDLWFLVPGWFVLFLVGLQVERIRYLLPLFPLLALMAAYGLRTLFSHAESRRFAAYSAVATSIVLLYAAYQPFLERTTMANLRDAGAYLDTLPGETVTVRILPQQASAGNTEASLPILDLFTRKRIIYERLPLARPDARTVSRSPLRFTWEQRLPAFYDGPVVSPAEHLVVLSGSARLEQRAADAPGPGQEGPLRVFAADTGNFRYRTAVTVLY